jgi:hypothetical protein
MNFREMARATSSLLLGFTFTFLFAMEQAQAEDNRCPTPSPEKLKALVLPEKQLKLGARSRHFLSDYSLVRAAVGSLEVDFGEDGVLDGDTFVVVVDPCQAKILRSFVRPYLITGTRAQNP